MALRIPKSYTPSAPNRVGTDDYRCFLLDPHLTRPTYLTGTYVLPGQPRRRAPRDPLPAPIPTRSVAGARPSTPRDPGEGWTCFGDTRPRPTAATSTTRRGSAPGRPVASETVDPPGLRRAAGGRLPDRHAGALQPARPAPGPTARATLLRLAPGDRAPRRRSRRCCCRRRSSCRAARATPTTRCATATPSIADVKRRFGDGRATPPTCLHLLCGRAARRPRCSSAPARSRSRRPSGRSPATCTCSAGRSRSRSTPAPPTRADGPRHPGLGLRQPGRQADQAGRRSSPGDTVKVTCRHVQWLRDRLPAFEGQPDRYVVWGEGTTDEMCLGILAGHPPLTRGREYARRRSQSRLRPVHDRRRP